MNVFPADLCNPFFSLFYRILAEVKSVPVVGSVQEYRSETDPSNAFVNPDILESSVKLVKLIFFPDLLELFR